MELDESKFYLYMHQLCDLRWVTLILWAFVSKRIISSSRVTDKQRRLYIQSAQHSAWHISYVLNMETVISIINVIKDCHLGYTVLTMLKLKSFWFTENLYNLSRKME